MACNETQVDVPPERVFELLADGRKYADWVVGADRVRSVEPEWPNPGSKFHHTVGVGPIKINDSTSVLEVDAPNRIVLDARARPLGRARVDIELRAQDGGTLVVMREELADGPRLMQRLTDPLIRVRNVEALRRLKDLVEPG
jgi:uncharacterized protein YndB with AHSA1/START domain